MVTLPGALHKPSFTPLWREPSAATKITSWPPKGYAEVYTVGTGNFWTVGRKFGRKNPWDLIIYNFQTETPREVNWYLHHAVGCWTSKDRENFAFDRAMTADALPGKIYIPHAGWVPDPKFEKGSGAGRFLHGIKTNVYSILEQLSRWVPSIAYQNSRMPSSGYSEVAELVNTGEVSIKIDPKLGEDAKYLPKEKTIYFGRIPRIGNLHMAGRIANEATHVFTHKEEISVNEYNNEVISSLAESLAVASLSPSWARQRMENTTQMLDHLYFPGWVWATEMRGISFIGESHLDQDFHHPVHGWTENPWRMLIKYHDSIPLYEKKRRLDPWDPVW